MDGIVPTAGRESLDRLLEYLGDTGKYSEFYGGNRADDFRKCFDTESQWCWEYAATVLRGFEHRELGDYSEGHHVVPMSCYKSMGVTKAARSRAMQLNNFSILKFSEHIYAHYCLVFAAREDFVDKMAAAFQYLYYNAFRGKKKGVYEFPSEEEFLKFLPTADAIRASSKRTQCAMVDADGRTHTWEDPDRAKRESAVATYWRDPEKHRRKSRESQKEKYDSDPEYREKKKSRAREWGRSNPDKQKEKNQRYYSEHRDEIAEQSKRYREEHREERREYNRGYREEHHDELLAKERARREIMGDTYNANRREKRANDADYRESVNSKLRDRRKNDPEYRKHVNEIQRKCAERKIAAGFRERKDPVTGKRRWIFVGLPETTEAA